MWLFLLALLYQGLDTGITCHNIKYNNAVELNPILGNTCKDIIIRKTLIFGTSYALLDNKKVSIAAIVTGSIGMSVTLILKLRE